MKRTSSLKPKTEGYLKINKKLIRTLGVFPSILISYYIDRFEYLKKKNITHNGWFFCTHKQLTEQLGIGQYAIRKYKKYLIDLEVLETKVKGVPAKEWFKIDFLNLNQLLNTGVPIQEVTEMPIQQSLINETIKRIHNYDESSLKKDFLGSDIPIVSSLFETFWKLYPKHPDKGKAKTTWDKICKKLPKERPTWRQIKTAIKLQKESDRWKDPQYIPHPTTWLNQSRWLDDPNEMKSFNREMDDKPKTIIKAGRRWTLRPNGYYSDDNGVKWIE